MEKLIGMTRNSKTENNRRSINNGLLIVTGATIMILDYLYSSLKNKGFRFCAMDINTSYLVNSHLPSSDLLYLYSRNEKEQNVLGSLDILTLELTTIPLIKSKILDSDAEVVYILVYLGDDFSNRTVLEAAKAGKELGKIVVGIIAMPPKWDGIQNTIRANDAFARLKPFVDTSFVFYRDIFDEDDSEIFDDFFSPLEIGTHTFKMPFDAIYRMNNQQGEIVIDASDVKALLKSGAFAVVGTGQCTLPDRMSIMLEQVLDSPYLQYLNKEKCSLILLSFEASEQNVIRMEEIEEFKQLLHEHFGVEVDMIIGLKEDNTLGEVAKVVCLFSFSEHEILSNL